MYTDEEFADPAVCFVMFVPMGQSIINSNTRFDCHYVFLSVNNESLHVSNVTACEDILSVGDC